MTNNRGFTLIEVLISVTVFSIGILSITGMLMLGRKYISSGIRSFNAVHSARAQMEILRDSSFMELSGVPCSVPLPPNVDCAYSVIKGIPAEGLSTLEVVARWHEGERDRQLVLSYIRFDEA